MQALDVMTKPVVSVSPWSTITYVVGLLCARGISGVPVLERGQLVGIVSAGNLLHRHEIGTDRRRPLHTWWQRLLSSDRGAEHYVRTHCVHVRDIMTTHVVTVDAQADIDEAAEVLDFHHVGRVPVMHKSQVVGIISRSDILRALAARSIRKDPSSTRSDAAIHDQLLRELVSQEWWRSDWSAIDVQEGIVSFRGLVSSEVERRAARVAAENIPGVRSVADHRIAANLWGPMV